METAPTVRRTRLGLWLVAAYFIVVVAAYALAALGEPDEFGYRWLLFFMLAMPWYSFTEHFFAPNSIFGAIPGFILNAGILLFAVTRIDKPRLFVPKRGGPFGQ
jgi:hypothetical protein